MSQQNSGFTSAYARGTLSAGCAFWALMLFSHYFILNPPDPSMPYKGYRMNTITMLNEVVGGVGLLVLSALFAVGSMVLALQARKSLAVVGNKIGPDELDVMKLEMARSRANKEGLISGMPAHLESVAAFRAQRRRLKFLFFLFIGVFSFIGLAGYFGLLQ